MGVKVSSGQFQPELRNQRARGSQDFETMTSATLSKLHEKQLGLAISIITDAGYILSRYF